MACSKNFVERLSRQLQCEVCCNDFDNDQYIPKLIPCGHTLCLRCLESLMKVDPYTRGVKILTCPKRCKSFPVPREGAKGFMTVRDLLIIKDIHVEEEEQRAKTSNVCENHQLDLKYYCRVCKIQICSECALEGHVEHTDGVAKYDDVFGDCKETLQGAQTRGKQTLQETRGLLHSMREVATLLRQAETRLQADVDDLDKLLDGGEGATEMRDISKMHEIAEAILPIVEQRDSDNASLNNCRFRRIMLILKSLVQNDSVRPPIKDDSSSITSLEEDTPTTTGSPEEAPPPTQTTATTTTQAPKPSEGGGEKKSIFSSETTMKQKQIYSTKTVSDQREPFNVYMVLDASDNMYTTDNFNNKLKCFNAQGQCYFETGRIGHVENVRLRNPLGLALMEGGNLALVDGDLNDCFILSGQDFSLKKQIQVLNCRGVAALQSTLVITTTTARVHVLDSETGTVITTLERDAAGKQIFHCPYYAVAKPGSELVAISDTVHGFASVRLMDTRTAEVVKTYQGMKLKSPKGVTYDPNGQLLVADDDRNCVALLTSDLQFVTDLVTYESGNVEPIAAASTSRGAIAVAEKKGKIKIYEPL